MLNRHQSMTRPYSFGAPVDSLLIEVKVSGRFCCRR